MRFEIKVTSDNGESFAGEGPTMSKAVEAFCAAMLNAPEPFSTEAIESWDDFHRDAARVAGELGL